MDKAWLTAIAAVLGVSEACHRHEAPDAVREVAPLASTTATASASAAPSATATVETAAASASTAAMPTPTTSTSTSAPLLRIGAGIGTGCGVRASCGASAHNTSKPTAQINAMIESGVANDDRVIAALRPRLRACANQGLAQDPNMRGRVVVYVNIAANGSVIDTSNSRIIGLSQAVADCMIASIKRAQFVASTPRHVSVTIEQTQQ